MKKILITSITAAVIFSLFMGCTSRQERYAKTIAEAETYMTSIATEPTMSINGDWEDTAFASWGSPVFIQVKNKIVGTMGMYSVQGVISGNKVYLIALNGGYLYYTITLEKVDGNTLMGQYVKGFNASKTFVGTRFILKRKRLANAI